MREQRKILLTDDDPDIRILFKKFLSEQKFTVVSAKNGAETLALVQKYQYDLIILDLMLPDAFGADLCKEIRKVTTTPILILTASQSEDHYIAGLESGADDFVQKTSGVPVIIAKVRAILRREMTKDVGIPIDEIQYEYVRFSGWKFYPKKNLLISPSEVELFLTDNETKLMVLLVEQVRKTVSRDTIGEWLGIRAQKNYKSAVDTLICRLRKKIAKYSDQEVPIKTIRNKGYQFSVTISYE